MTGRTGPGDGWRRWPASVSLGEFAVPLGDVLASLAGAGEKASNYIVLELRLPRALTGLLAGAAFGLAGDSFFAEFSPENFRLMDQDVGHHVRLARRRPLRAQSSGAWTRSRRIA